MLKSSSFHDIEDMKSRVKALPRQMEESVGICASFTPSPGLLNKKFTSIVLCGMGGSAISGDVMSAYLSDECTLPVKVVRNYSLPAFVDENTLLIAVSYSGNTEETLFCLEEGKKRNAGLFCISSGGKVLDVCERSGLDHVPIPSGWPPRSALGYLIVPICCLLQKMGYCETTVEEMVDRAVPVLEQVWSELVGASGDNFIKLNKLVNGLSRGMLMVYAPPAISVVARRWMTQLNENSKVLAHWGVIPEMNHNELVGWGNDGLKNYYKVVFLDYEFLLPRIKKRIQLTREIILGRGIQCVILHLPGKDVRDVLMAGIYMGDIFSLVLAEEREIDPSPVEVIEELKRKMAE